MFLKAASHSKAIAVEQATDASLGTLMAAEALGKCSANIIKAKGSKPSMDLVVGIKAVRKGTAI